MNARVLVTGPVEGLQAECASVRESRDVNGTLTVTREYKPEASSLVSRKGL